MPASPVEITVLPPAPDPRAELIAAFGQHAPSHSHSLGLMVLFLKMLLSCAVGFRGAAAVLKVVSPLFPTDEEAPSPNGGQMWVLRVGLYELSRPKEQADDWVWIVDHTIQIGCVKVLVVVGVRLSAWEAKRADPDQSAALEHGDLSVWMLEPMEKSDGPAVLKQLEELSKQTGMVPRQVLNDCGADLLNGVGRFVAEHPQTRASHDISHAAANAVKRELNHDPQWTAFLADASHAKAKLRQTKFAFLLPPELKAKARWMNLDPLLTWSRKVLAFVATPRPVPGASWEEGELEEKMGWIRGYQPLLESWSQMLQVIACILKYIRQHGYHQDARRELQAELANLSVAVETPAARVAESLLAFVDEQSSGIPAGQRLLGSSEVLESLIGKAKQLEGQQSKSGFTKMILGLAASVCEVTENKVQEALTAVKVKDVISWIKSQLGISLQGQRQHAFPPFQGTKQG
jgi:hypothetical protein